MTIIVVGNADARIALEQTLSLKPKALEGYILRQYAFGEKLEDVNL